MKCPNCSSADQLFKMSVLYEAGTTTTQSGATYGMGFLNDGDLTPDVFGVARSSSQNISQTLLARKCAPPEKPVQISQYGILIALFFLGIGLFWQFNMMEDGEGISKLSLVFYIVAFLIFPVATVYGGGFFSVKVLE